MPHPLALLGYAIFGTSKHMNVGPSPTVAALSFSIIAAFGYEVAGPEGWTDVENFGKQKQAWLSQFLDLENGIPSHDPIGRVFVRLDAQSFRQSFLSWVQAVFEVSACLRRLSLILVSLRGGAAKSGLDPNALTLIKQHQQGHMIGGF